jgi:hypothetical protein
MTTTALLALIGIILMVLGSLPIPSPVDLWKLGWAFVVSAFFFGSGGVLH